jgi:hypothetical protein
MLTADCLSEGQNGDNSKDCQDEQETQVFDPTP